MQIQINIDHKLDVHEATMAQFRSTVQGALSRFSEHITRVELHFRTKTPTGGQSVQARMRRRA